MELSELNYNSVENIPGVEARAAFTVNSAAVFREEVNISCQRVQSGACSDSAERSRNRFDENIVPIILNDRLSYMPWGGYNL